MKLLCGVGIVVLLFAILVMDEIIFNSRKRANPKRRRR